MFQVVRYYLSKQNLCGKQMRPCVFFSKQIAFLFSSLILLTANVYAQNRVALVIGNGDYLSFTRLDNPTNDANDMAKTLDYIGFDVIKVLNASHEEMEDALEQFESKLTPNSMSVIFYAGHGVQSKGENYLIPVSANIEKERQLKSRAMSASGLLGVLDKNSNGTNLVILDACRDNPLAGTSRSGTRGLAKIRQEPANTMILYATQANATAADGSGRNGLFTKHLLRAMRDSSKSFATMIDSTIAGVKKESGNDQRPAFYSSFTGANISLHPNWTAQQKSHSGENPDDVAYFTIKEEQDISSFEDYLQQFPNGRWAQEAREKIEDLKSITTTKDSPTFVFTKPDGSKLSFEGSYENSGASNEVDLYLIQGSNLFTLAMKNGRKIYGDLQLTYLDAKVKRQVFGLNETLPKSKHITAAMRGSPVKYRIKMNTDEGIKQVVNYRLSLRPIRN